MVFINGYLKNHCTYRCLPPLHSCTAPTVVCLHYTPALHLPLFAVITLLHCTYRCLPPLHSCTAPTVVCRRYTPALHLPLLATITLLHCTYRCLPPLHSCTAPTVVCRHYTPGCRPRCGCDTWGSRRDACPCPLSPAPELRPAITQNRAAYIIQQFLTYLDCCPQLAVSWMWILKHFSKQH